MAKYGMNHTDGTSRERRWAVISEDGRHTWLGRHSDPTDAELADITGQLQAKNIVSWLAITEGVYWQPNHEMRVLLVRPLSGQGDWEKAKNTFLMKRATYLGETDKG